MAACSSKNAVSLSSARTVKRWPSGAYASAVKSTRPLESLSDEQPQLNPALLRLSAMISQYFTAAPYPIRRASRTLPHFPERADARDIRGSPDRLAEVCESHKFVPGRR